MSHASASLAAQRAAQPDQILTFAARAGYAARGIVYLIVGGLALLAALNLGGGTTGSRGAIASLFDEPWGKTLVFIIGVGLVGYAIWRFLQAHYDLDDHGTDAKGLAIRGGLLVSALVHIGLAVWAFTAVFQGSVDEGEGSHRWVSWLLDKPGGQWWVGLLALAIFGAGVAQFVKGFKQRFERYLDMDYRRWPWARTLCRVGLMARGIAYGVIAWFFLQAALESDSSEAGGLGEVLRAAQEQPFGRVLLGLMALGLLAFGVYSLIEAIYRRINPPGHVQVMPET